MINPDPGLEEYMVEEQAGFFIGLFPLLLILVIVPGLLCPLPLRAQTINLENTRYQTGDLVVSLFPKSPLQGQAVIVSIQCRQDSPAPRHLFLLGKKYKIATFNGGEYKAVCAVPLNASPGPTSLKIILAGAKAVKIPLTVRVGAYGEEHLHLPTEMVHPVNAAHLHQIKEDRRRLRQIYASSQAVVRFLHPFMQPLKSVVITPFGRRRFLNETPKSPHGGIDLRGKTGTPVPAAARGKVAFSGRLYYSGNAVIIDHGLDVFSLYLHLDSLSVAAGELVNQGQIIGTLGSTGRVTGPHLHWGIKINGIFVDPLEFIKESRLLLPSAGEE